MDALVIGTFSVLSLSAIALQRITSENSKEDQASKEKNSSEEDQEKTFKSLKRKFFGAYFLAIFGTVHS